MTGWNRLVAASARDAGRNVLHTVTVDGEVVGTRRSAHRYAYAICRWHSGHLTVTRWSRSAKTTGPDFAVRVLDKETP